MNWFHVPSSDTGWADNGGIHPHHLASSSFVDVLRPSSMLFLLSAADLYPQPAAGCIPGGLPTPLVRIQAPAAPCRGMVGILCFQTSDRQRIAEPFRAP